MLKDKEHIDYLFAKGLHDYEEKAPSYLWNNIQAELKHKKRVYRYSKIRVIAASIALLMTFGLGYLSSDYALRKKYEAKYLRGSGQEKVLNERTIRAEDSASTIADDTVLLTAEVNDQKETKKVVNNKLDENDSQKQGILYKLFNLSKDIFFMENNNELNTNQLARENKTREENIPNQLLIDTLLLGKENLHEGGFLLNEKRRAKSNWSFGTKFSPVYSMAENSSGDNNSSAEQTHSLKGAAKDERPDTKAVEKSLLAFSGGVNVNYHLSERWSLESGLFYSQRKQMAENLVGSAMTGYEDEMMVYTPAGARSVQSEFSKEEPSEIIGTSRDETYYSLNMDYISNFEYIELPLLVRYKIVDRKLGLDVLSGVSTNFLIGNKTSITNDESQLWSGETDDVSPLLYNATLGLGLNYNFYRNFSFNLEPTFKYSIVPSSTSVLARYPYSFAVFAGFSYRFK